MAKLLIQSGTLAGKSQEFTDKLNLGRNQTNDMVLLDKKISGNHALIFYDNGHFMLMDLDSTNGTKLNGNKLAPKSPMTLKTGDRIEIEGYQFAFEDVGGRPASKNPNIDPSGSTGKQVSFSFDNIEDLKELAKWLKFVGTYSFIVGSLLCLTIIGALVGWLPIVLGLMLREAGAKMMIFAAGGPGSQFLGGIEKLRNYFKWNGIIMIISLVALGLSALGFLIALIAGLSMIR